MRYNMGAPVMGSINGSPDSKGSMLMLAYLPVQNAKLELRYTAYQQFNGARTNYDGFGHG